MIKPRGEMPDRLQIDTLGEVCLDEARNRARDLEERNWRHENFDEEKKKSLVTSPTIETWSETYFELEEV